MVIAAIDPGSERSAWLIYEDGAVRECAVLDNEEILAALSYWSLPWGEERLAIEWLDYYGMAVGRDVFDTVRWIGRFQQAWRDPDAVVLIPRKEVMLDLCGSRRAKDSNVRAALIDKFGGRAKAIGRKKSPGPLYRVPGDGGHKWNALAVAVVAEERLKTRARRTA